MGRNAHIPADDTQRFIIEKSAAVFNKKGFAGTSITDLEKITGLTKGSIYANFKDKEEVSIKVFEYNYDQLRQSLLERIKNETTAKGKLQACINFYLEFYATLITNGGCVLQNALIDSDDANPLLFESARKALKSWTRHFIEIIEQGMKTDEFKTEIIAEEYAYYMIAVIEGAILVSKSINKPTIFESILSKLNAEIMGL
jgi:TetR/AcrR family transcriptional repressor of nem operon